MEAERRKPSPIQAERRETSPIQAERRKPPGVWSTRPKPLASAFAANWDAANILKSNRTANHMACTTLWCLIGIQAISIWLRYHRAARAAPLQLHNRSGAAQAARCLEYTAKNRWLAPLRLIGPRLTS
jgi:hypothetical protein